MKIPQRACRLDMRNYFSDTLALLTFSLAVGAFVELAIAGLSLEQVIRVRVAAMPIALLTGRPYGIYRNWLFKCLQGTGEHVSQLRRLMIDTLSNVTFQIPLYVLILTFNGATMGQIITAVSSIIVVVTLSGRPYGIYLIWCRKLFGVPVKS